MLGALLDVILALSLAQLAPDYRVTYTEDATTLRSSLLSGYDKIVPPRSNRSVTYSEAGTDVGLQIRFFKVDSIDVPSGSMNLKVWFRLSWTDSRLAWNDSFSGLTQTTFDQDEVWTPDITHYNSKQGIPATFDSAVITANSNGGLFWSRPGVLEILCKYSGLANFPRDALKCMVEVGGWAYSGATQGIAFTGGGYAFSSQELTAGASYQEFTIAKVSASLTTYFYQNPSEPWPIALYTIELSRHSVFADWIIHFVWIFTMLSILPACMSYEVGERLGFGITTVLVMEVAKQTLAAELPKCGEMLWADVFIIISEFVALAALGETCIVLALSFYTDEYLFPPWISQLCARIVYGSKKVNQAGWSDTTKLFATSTGDGESSAGQYWRRVWRRRFPDAASSRSEEASDHVTALSSTTGAAEVNGGDASKDAKAKLIFYERTFFQIDSSAQGMISLEDAEKFLSFAALDLEPAERAKAVRVADSTNDGELVRWEFVQMCAQVMEDVPMDVLEMAQQNFASAQSFTETRNTEKWQSTAKSIDMYTRFVFLTFYPTFVLFMYNLDFSDQYDIQGSDMFAGIATGSMNAAGVLNSLIVPIIAGFLSISWLLSKKVAKKKGLIEDAPTSRRASGKVMPTNGVGPTTEE